MAGNGKYNTEKRQKRMCNDVRMSLQVRIWDSEHICQLLGCNDIFTGLSWRGHTDCQPKMRNRLTINLTIKLTITVKA